MLDRELRRSGEAIDGGGCCRILPLRRLAAGRRLAALAEFDVLRRIQLFVPSDPFSFFSLERASLHPQPEETRSCPVPTMQLVSVMQ